MRRLTTRPDRAPVTGPAAWFIRFVGVNGVIGPLGFGGFTIPAIISVAQGRGIIDVWGNPTYGDGPFERIGVPTTVPLLAGFLAACLVQLVGAGLLIGLRPSGFIVMPAGMLLSAIFWWGFDLPLAWLGAGPDLAFLAAAWLVYTRASRKLVQRANPIPHCNQHQAPASQPEGHVACLNFKTTIEGEPCPLTNLRRPRR